MAQTASTEPVGPAAEADVEREARLAWERERLDEAFDDIANRRVISGQAALDWLDRWAAGEEMDEPPSR
ncbi:MAG: hypothetical protein U1A07_12015 [Phenylobacterium sp.]|uniref:hypothetical protein n=1 Tax=Brevundimonas sp. TaxID=1871086 RepID=UPI00271F4FF2|nr:hypothetical protein [Brevundimonas sp.]MDO9586483.1 hypothetical protein [Brevundimonas sp.]MDZ4319539.1 hypothetical protein [Phenylobacterium sp.]